MSARGKAHHKESWQHVVDGWMLRTQVRRDLLLALGMVLLATVIVVALVTGFLGGLVPQLLPTLSAKIAAGAALLTGSIGSGMIVRRRRRQRTT